MPETSDLVLQGVFPDKRRPQPSTGSQHYNLKFGIHVIKEESLQSQAHEPQMGRARKMGPQALARQPNAQPTPVTKVSLVLTPGPGIADGIEPCVRSGRAASTLVSFTFRFRFIRLPKRKKSVFGNCEPRI